MSTDQAQRLTLRQERFVTHYIASGNATQAAAAAGYAVPRQQGSENLSKPVIQQAIEQQQRKLAQSHQQVTPEWVISKLAERASDDSSPASSVSALRTLADILGMTNAGARELPQHVETFLAFIAGELHGSQLSKPASGKVIELSEPRRSDAGSEDDV